MSTLYIPAGSITDAEIASNADIGAAKVIHEIAVFADQVPGTAVVAATRVVHVARAAGTIAAFKIGVITAPTGGDKAYTVDLQKSTGTGAFASVLSAAYTVNSSSADKTAYSATLGTTTTYVAGDIFEIVIAVSGSTGTQGQGVIAEAFFEEATA
jgi:hypothetical protein